MNKILYISYDGMTDNLGQSQVIPYLKGLSEKGYQFSLLSFEKPHNFSRNKEKIATLLKETKIAWYPVNYTSKPPVLSTIKDIRTLLKKAKQLHKKEHFEIVHCRSYISAFAGLLLKRKYGVKFVFDMRGFWPDERVEGKVWNLSSPLYRMVYNYFKRQENKYFTHADYTISLTNTGKNEIHSWKQIINNPIPIQVIPCCADFDHFCVTNQQRVYTKQLSIGLGIKKNDFVLSYLGSVGTWYMLPEMLDFFKVLLVKKPDAKFLFITGEPERLIFKSVKEKGIPQEHFIIRSATREEVPAYIALSNLSIFFIIPTFSKKASSPTKMAEIMGMGIPLICNDNVGDVSNIIEQTGAGFAIKEFNEEGYEKAINQIDDLMQINPQKIRDEAIKQFSLKEGVERYGEVYEKIIKF